MSQNTENQNTISPNPNDENDQGMPSANVAGRDSGDSKKLKKLGVVLFAIVLMLLAVGLSIGRYNENRAVAKAEAAEQAAQDQRNMKETSGGVNIAKDQAIIEANAMHDLPIPADGIDDTGVDIANGNTVQGQPTIVQPAQPMQTYQPQYNDYSNQPVQPVQANDAPTQSQQFTATATQPIQLEIADVLVDVYGAAKALDAAKNANQETGLANQFKSSKLMDGTVSKSGDATMLLAKGTTIPCTLRTKIDSTYKGFTTCQLSKDVYSANGKVLLLERGSTVFGEQNVEIKQGQARVAVLWSRIETPKGVSVDIDSPAAGQLGEMGIGAKVNNHFWKRFGGAIMLSMVKDLSANASTHLAKDGQSTENTTQNTSNAVEQMAAKALENTINIPPTATVNHGKLINILVVRDVDFGGVYELRKN